MDWEKSERGHGEEKDSGQKKKKGVGEEEGEEEGGRQGRKKEKGAREINTQVPDSTWIRMTLVNSYAEER